MLAGFFAMLPDDYENLSQSVIATNGFGNNILAAITTKDYWAVANDYKPLMHTWYVGVLMQFYLVYPILFLLARLDKKNPKGTLLTFISTLAIISLLIYFTTTDNAQRFYYLPSRFFEFAVGGITALIYKPQEYKPFGRGYVYVCYVLLLAMLFVNIDVIAPIARLVAVVAISCVLLCSQNVLENKVTGNAVLSKIGAASYSIFIWHQVLLAFYRYTISCEFTIVSYVILLVVIIVLSWLSYCFIEKVTTEVLKSKRGKSLLYATVLTVFIGLNGFAGFIYMKAGVVRDVPELYISKNDVHRGMHAEYCDRGYSYNRPFETDKLHWLVIGNSFGRDFVNMILESDIADEVEVSYIYTADLNKDVNNSRYANADRVFVSNLPLNEDLVSKIEIKCLSNSFPPEKLVIVGEKNFGESNGQFYVKRNSPDYFYLRTRADHQMVERNEYFRDLYKTRFFDLFALVIDKEGNVPVFTPDHHYISHDCEHFSKGGAVYFGEMVDWKQYMN